MNGTEGIHQIKMTAPQITGALLRVQCMDNITATPPGQPGNQAALIHHSVPRTTDALAFLRPSLSVFATAVMRSIRTALPKPAPAPSLLSLPSLPPRPGAYTVSGTHAEISTCLSKKGASRCCTLCAVRVRVSSGSACGVWQPPCGTCTSTSLPVRVITSPILCQQAPQSHIDAALSRPCVNAMGGVGRQRAIPSYARTRCTRAHGRKTRKKN